jgi:hypothetical protein
LTADSYPVGYYRNLSRGRFNEKLVRRWPRLPLDRLTTGPLSSVE